MNAIKGRGRTSRSKYAFGLPTHQSPLPSTCRSATGRGGEAGPTSVRLIDPDSTRPRNAAVPAGAADPGPRPPHLCELDQQTAECRTSAPQELCTSAPLHLRNSGTQELRNSGTQELCTFIRARPCTFIRVYADGARGNRYPGRRARPGQPPSQEILRPVERLRVSGPSPGTRGGVCSTVVLPPAMLSTARTLFSQASVPDPWSRRAVQQMRRFGPDPGRFTALRLTPSPVPLHTVQAPTQPGQIRQCPIENSLTESRGQGLAAAAAEAP